MTSIRRRLSGLRSALARAGRGLVPAANANTRLQVCHQGPTGPGTDPWVKGILERGDGRPVAEVIDMLYKDEITTGAWAVDIGLWKGLFDESVLKTIGRLVDNGYVCLKPDNDKSGGTR